MNNNGMKKGLKPETIQKINVARRLIEEEYDINYITKVLGYVDKSTTLALLRENGVHVPRDLQCIENDTDKKWFEGKADPSGLTEEELRRAKFLDITPERWAWLKSCPKGGNATHNGIYF